MSRKVQNVQECDATNAESWFVARHQISRQKIFIPVNKIYDNNHLRNCPGHAAFLYFIASLYRTSMGAHDYLT